VAHSIQTSLPITIERYEVSRSNRKFGYMIRVNSISGGKTSAYIAANYKADYNVFALVTTNDLNCIYPDSFLRKEVSQRINREFIGTLEDDKIIKTIFELEQFTGTQITWVVGEPFENIIKKKGDYLPNIMTRYCTTALKLQPIFDFWQTQIGEPVEMRIGFRANETKRAERMIKKTNDNGLLEFKTIIGKKNGRNRWAQIQWQKPSFPLIENRIFKDQIETFWKNKPVDFAEFNNCVGCFHRNEMFLKFMSEMHPNKFDWFIKRESETNNTFKNGITYQKIKEYKMQMGLFSNDFTNCDSGSCGL
jgi:hypothetical protein